MSKVRRCGECNAAVGHYSWCVGRGYAMTGPHPDAPKAPDVGQQDRPLGECPCGVDRSVCEWHDPRRNPTAPVVQADDTSECGVEHHDDLLRMGIELPQGVGVSVPAYFKGVLYAIVDVNPFTLRPLDGSLSWRPLA